MRLGSRDAHRAVERQLLCVHVLEDLHRFARGIIALEHLATEDHAGRLDLLRQANFFLAREQGNRAHLREVHADRVVDPLRTLLGERLLDGRLHLGVVEDVLLDVEVVWIRTLFFTAGFAFGSLLLALVLLDLKLSSGKRGSGRLRRSSVCDAVGACALLRVVALELEVRLKRCVEADVVVATNLDFVDHLDRVFAHEDEQLVDLLRINELVGKAGIQLLVTNPATANAVLDELPKDGRGDFKGV